MGKLKLLLLDLNDLESVKAAAATFAQQESKLDVLWNNAATGPNRLPPGAKTAQGLEPMVGMHCVAPLLFTQLLIPQLRAATTTSDKSNSPRVVWTSSFLTEAYGPPNGMDLNKLKDGTGERSVNYAVCKLGNWMLAREMARRYGKDGIISVTQNPGNLNTAVFDGTSSIKAFLFANRFVLYEPKFGAYTELYAGLSPDITLETNGSYIVPWGSIRPDNENPRKDILNAITPVEEGGLGYTSKFWEWCEQQWQHLI